MRQNLVTLETPSWDWSAECDTVVSATLEILKDSAVLATLTVNPTPSAGVTWEGISLQIDSKVKFNSVNMEMLAQSPFSVKYTEVRE